MKNIFKTDYTTSTAFLPSAPALRSAITGFIIQSLQPYTGEKAVSIAGLHFYIFCDLPEQEVVARVALYMDRPGMFKTEELERQLLNYFIQTEPAWFFEYHIVSKLELPENCIRKDNFGLQLCRSGEQLNGRCKKAQVEVLAGQAEHAIYTLDPRQQIKFYIGRSRSPQLSSGKIQHNDIVFTDGEDSQFNGQNASPNAQVSRNHAFLVYEAATGNWLLYPDKGGLPENGNKLKVHTHDDKLKWLNIFGVSHILCDGDQVELGGTAVLRFHSIKDGIR